MFANIFYTATRLWSLRCLAYIQVAAQIIEIMSQQIDKKIVIFHFCFSYFIFLHIDSATL